MAPAATMALVHGPPREVSAIALEPIQRNTPYTSPSPALSGNLTEPTWESPRKSSPSPTGSAILVKPAEGATHISNEGGTDSQKDEDEDEMTSAFNDFTEWVKEKREPEWETLWVRQEM